MMLLPASTVSTLIEEFQEVHTHAMSQLFRLCEELSTLEISYEGFVNEMDLGVDASGKEPFCQYVAVKDTLKFC